MVTMWPIPVFNDNYVWVLQVDDCDEVLVVDPGSGEPVMAALSQRDLRPAAVLVTHHHADHVGGVAPIVEGRKIPVYGPAGESIRLLSRPVRDADRIEFSVPAVALDVLDVPGHTAGHVAYVGDGFVFCGDTLFAGGCGRVFEGTPRQMLNSLNRLAELAPETSIYCAHEYTENNLRFATEVEPGNPELSRRLERIREQRARDLPTVPSTVDEELRTNPFLRCSEPGVIAAAERHAARAMADPVDVFATIRGWKDGWRG